MHRRLSFAIFAILTVFVAPLTALSPGTDVLVPGAAIVADWRTDLYILNPGEYTANVTVELLVRDQANPTPESQVFVIPPGETAVLENVLENTFGKTSFSGAIRVTSDQGVVVNSRIFNLKEGVTFGQGYEGIPREMAVQEGASTDIVALAKNDSFRTNLVMLEAGGEAGVSSQVRVTLYDEQGSQVATRELELDQFEPFLKRIDHADLFGSTLADFDYGTLHCEVLSGAVIFSASKVDNDSATGDPTTLEAWAGELSSTPPPPTGDVYLYSSTGDDDLAATIGEWSSGSILTELTDDPDYPRIMQVDPGTAWGDLSSCISFEEIPGYLTNFDGIAFKIRSDELNAINVKIPEIELTYAFADATDLENGWFEFSIPFSDFVGTDPDPNTFGILSGYGLGATFYITDVKLTVED
jgi:hypothetical protein